MIGIRTLLKIGTAESGNFGHAGRPGEIGGSSSEGEAFLKEGRFSSLDEWEGSLNKEQRDSLQTWMYIAYAQMRDSDKRGDSESHWGKALGNLKQALSTAPIYTEELYRGIRADIKLSVGDKVSMSAISSFSTNIAVGKTFAVTTPEGKLTSLSTKFTVLAVVKHSGAERLPRKPVKGTYETEAVFRKGREFKVASVEKMEIKRPGGKVWKGKKINLEEV